MPKQPIFEGFDTKCRFCGNLYSAKYIDFHIKERCLKNPETIQSRSAVSNQNPLISNVTPTSQKQNSTPKYKITSITLPSNSNSNKPPVHSNEIRKEKNRVFCPNCAASMNLNKYEKHITEKCPTLRQKKKNADVKNKIRIKPLRKKQPIKFPELDKIYVPVQKNKVRCSKCGQIYLNTEIQCLECLRLEQRNKSLIKCPRCEKSFDEENYNKHLSKCFDSEICCLICRETFSCAGFQLHNHKKEDNITIDISNKISKERILCEFCNCLVNIAKQERHLRKSCPKVKVVCEFCKMEFLRIEINRHLLLIHKIDAANDSSGKTSNSSKKEFNKNKSGVYIKPLALKKSSNHKKCRICGRIAMYNSSHCYSCGDK